MARVCKHNGGAPRRKWTSPARLASTWPHAGCTPGRRSEQEEASRCARACAGATAGQTSPAARAAVRPDAWTPPSASTAALTRPRGPSPQCSAPSCTHFGCCCEEAAALHSSRSQQVAPRASGLASETTTGVGSRAIAEVALLCKQRALLFKKAWPGSASTTEALRRGSGGGSGNRSFLGEQPAAAAGRRHSFLENSGRGPARARAARERLALPVAPAAGGATQRAAQVNEGSTCDSTSGGTPIADSRERLASTRGRPTDSGHAFPKVRRLAPLAPPQVPVLEHRRVLQRAHSVVPRGSRQFS